MVKWIKNQWKLKGCFYRTVRTFVQVFVGTASGYITQLLSGDMTVSSAVALAAATGLCAVMNIKPAGEVEEYADER